MFERWVQIQTHFLQVLSLFANGAEPNIYNNDYLFCNYLSYLLFHLRVLQDICTHLPFPFAHTKGIPICSVLESSLSASLHSSYILRASHCSPSMVTPACPAALLSHTDDKPRPPRQECWHTAWIECPRLLNYWYEAQVAHLICVLEGHGRKEEERGRGPNWREKRMRRKKRESDTGRIGVRERERERPRPRERETHGVWM